MSIRGSCHCGKVTFTVDADPAEAVQCNCSICRRRGHLLTFVSLDQFTLETPREEIAVYTFGKHVIRHQFCKTCGCAPFAEGTAPGTGAMVAVNLRCADDFDLSKVTIKDFDGASLP